MRVLDLFSGTGGWSAAFLDRGHEVYRIDNDEQFADVPHTTIVDVLRLGPMTDRWDVILASPPCQAFSLAATGTHMTAYANCRTCGTLIVKRHESWEHTHPASQPDHSARAIKTTLRLEPRTDFGKLSVRLVERTLELVDLLRPHYWWMENPNGGMIHFVPDSIPRVQTTYCQYGESRQKLTNLWGQWPDTWKPRPRCKNGAPCHASAPRGAKTGTQGIKGAVDRAIVPYELSLEVCKAVEEAMG